MAVAIKILPGKTQDVKEMFKILKNEKWAELVESQRRQGITMERDFLQTTPEGDLLISYWEGENLLKAMNIMTSSKDPFDVWLKQQYKNISGINMDQPPTETDQAIPLLLSFDANLKNQPNKP